MWPDRSPTKAIGYPTSRVSRLCGGIHTPLQTRFVWAPPEADGRNPIRGFTELAPHRCRATPDWRGFLTAIGSRSFPIGRPFDQTPPVGRTGLDTRPSRQRWGTGTRRADASRHYGRRRRISPPWQEGNHAPQCGRVHLSCRARSVTTRRFAGVPPDLQARV